MLHFLKYLRTPEYRVAWLVAIAADVLQLVALPLFAAGSLSPIDLMLDLAAAVVLVRLLGWHWALLPTLLAELIPGISLVPTWTAAVFYVTHVRANSHEPEILPPGPAPPRRTEL
jgi:hypothetical protein